MRSRCPERAEIHGRVARLPPAEKALERRMESNVVELARLEEAVAADSGVGRGDLLERPPREVGRKDDVNHVLADERALRSDRVDHRHRSFEREVCPDPHLLLELPPERFDEALAAVDTAARQEPVLTSRLLVPAQEDSPFPT